MSIHRFNLNEKKDSQFQVQSNSNIQYNFTSSLYSPTNESDFPNKSIETPKQNFSLLITFSTIALLIVLINLRVFKIVTTETQKRNRSINFFVAHLSFLAVGFTCVVFIYVMEKSNIFSLTAPGLCEILSFLRNIFLGLFPLNSMAITYVRARCSASNVSNTFLYLTLILIWIIATVGSVPSIFMVEYTKDSFTNLEKCKQIPLLGTFEATLLYEVFRFLVYHFLVCSYMAYAMVKIRFRIRYLYILKPIPNKMKRRVQKVRFVYFHSIIFILIWLPAGLGLGLYKLRTRIDWMAEYINVYITAIVVLVSSLFILSPLVYVFLHEETLTLICKGMRISGRNCTRNGIEANVNTNAQVEISCKNKLNVRKNERAQNNKYKKKGNTLHEVTTDMSRISTMAASEISVRERSIISYRKINVQSITTLKSCLKISSVLNESQTTDVQTFVDGKGHTIDVKQQTFVRETLV